MSENKIRAQIDPNTKKDELLDLPDGVKREVEAHLELYRTNPEAAHIWDPIVAGTPGGPIKCAMITYTGRKSGKKMQTVLQYYLLDGKPAVVGTRGGSVDHPNWYLNLVANPECEIQMGPDRRTARARTLNDEERSRYWDQIVSEQPEYLVYAARTSRVFPVVVFE